MPFVVDDIPTLAARYGSPISNLNTSDPDNPGPLIKRQDPIYGLPGRLERCVNSIFRREYLRRANVLLFLRRRNLNPKFKTL